MKTEITKPKRSFYELLSLTMNGTLKWSTFIAPDKDYVPRKSTLTSKISVSQRVYIHSPKVSIVTFNEGKEVSVITYENLHFAEALITTVDNFGDYVNSKFEQYSRLQQDEE